MLEYYPKKTCIDIYKTFLKKLIVSKKKIKIKRIIETKKRKTKT